MKTETVLQSTSITLLLNTYHEKKVWDGLFWAPLPDPSPHTFLITCGLRCDAHFFDVQQICWYQLHGYVRTCAFGRLWVSACDYASVCFYVCMFVSQVHQNVMTFSGIVRNVYKNHKDQRHKHIKKKYR